MMKKLVLVILTVSIILNAIFFYTYIRSFRKKIKQSSLIDYAVNDNQVLKNLTYYDGHELSVIGKFHDEQNYNRLPDEFKNIVRPEVWSLSKNSSGISLTFKTNSQAIGVKWKVKNNYSPANMTKIGASGVDLYCYKNGKWQFVNSGIPTGFNNESLIISGLDTAYKDFMLNLPLYDITESIEIGVQADASISPGQIISKEERKPIVFYGTSITQGGSASRPGMNYPSIISRYLNHEIINLGFSGNGRFEHAVGIALCAIDSKMIILDCTPNSSPETIISNVPKLLRQLRICKPETPILIIESITREFAHFKTSGKEVFGSGEFIQRQNQELRNAYVNAVNDNIPNLHYLASTDLIGTDHEGTVDGTHLSDLGLSRIADKVKNRIVEILTAAGEHH